MIEIVEVAMLVKQPLSKESFREYLKQKGWHEEPCPVYEKWRHESGKAPLLNLTENHLSHSLNALAEYEGRCNFAVWQDIMQPATERNQPHEPRYSFVLDGDVVD